MPRWLRTAWVCRLVVTSDSYSFGLGEVINQRALEYVPKSLRTAKLCAELCLAAAAWNRSALKFVPKSLRTAELCLAAVRQDEEALKFVPSPLRAEVLAKIEEQTPGGEVV